MNDLVSLIQMVLVLAATVLSIVGAIWLLAGDSDHVAWTNSGHLPWPRGIQEEEPLPWKIRPAMG